MFGMGMQEVVIIGIIAVLLFGSKLPEVAKSLGASYREFRKGLSDLQSQIDFSDTTPYSSTSSGFSHTESNDDDFDDYDEVTAPKFEPPPAASPPAASRDAAPGDAEDGGKTGTADNAELARSQEAGKE
ncbi:MAG: twin-arginine translocase TatA/TatE family subunit [Pirellulaceae bacterium]